MSLAVPPESPAPSRSNSTRRSSIIVPSRGGSVFSAIGKGGEESQSTSIKLNNILKLVKDGIVITKSLKKAVLEAGQQFGVRIEDDSLSPDVELKSQRLGKHTGHNQHRMVRNKVKMQRPIDIPPVESALRKHGAHEREHVREANRRVAISLIFQYEQSRVLSEKTSRDSMTLLANKKKNQTQQLVVITFVKNTLTKATDNVCRRLVAEKRRRQRELRRRARAAYNIFRIWRLYRVIKFRKAMFSFVRFRKFHERIVEARDEETFRKRVIKREERERVVFTSYQQRKLKPAMLPGPLLSALNACSPPRKACDIQKDTEGDLVAQWMAHRLSPRGV